jgi:uncharacterized membrane protein YgcG
MKRLRVVSIVIAGVALPLALAAAAVLISSGVGASTPVAPLPAGQENREGGPSLSPTPSQSDQPSESPSSPDPPSSTPTLDNHGGKCSEAEHSNDPSCTPDGSSNTPGDDGSSGSSSSSSDGGGSGGGSGGGDD